MSTAESRAAYQRDYYHSSPDRKEKYNARAKRYRDTNPVAIFAVQLKKYGITPDDYNFMYTEQNGQCLLCARPIAAARSGAERNDIACVDHCHATGKVRGLLCLHCNRGLGLFADNPDVLRNAASYIEENT